MSKDFYSHFSSLKVLDLMAKWADPLEKRSLSRKIARENIFVESEVVGQSTLAAKEAADKWIAAARNT